MVLGLHPRFRVALLPLLFLQKAWLENEASMSVAQVMTCNVQRLLRLTLTKRRTWNFQQTNCKRNVQTAQTFHHGDLFDSFRVNLFSLAVSSFPTEVTSAHAHFPGLHTANTLVQTLLCRQQQPHAAVTRATKHLRKRDTWGFRETQGCILYLRMLRRKERERVHNVKIKLCGLESWVPLRQDCSKPRGGVEASPPHDEVFILELAKIGKAKIDRDILLLTSAYCLHLHLCSRTFKKHGRLQSQQVFNRRILCSHHGS